VINVKPRRNALTVFASERAAWLHREHVASKPSYTKVTDAPVELTRSDVHAAAKSLGVEAVWVKDESGQIVEEWSV
jgi:hypothetical protein